VARCYLGHIYATKYICLTSSPGECGSPNGNHSKNCRRPPTHDFALPSLKAMPQSIGSAVPAALGGRLMHISVVVRLIFRSARLEQLAVPVLQPLTVATPCGSSGTFFLLFRTKDTSVQLAHNITCFQGSRGSQCSELEANYFRAGGGGSTDYFVSGGSRAQRRSFLRALCWP